MSQRHDLARAVSYKYRLLRAYVRFYLKYTPEVLDKMTTKELVDAWSDIVFVRSKRSRFEPEE